MAIKPGTDPTLDAARQWKETCLLGDGSILSPGERLWTPAHIDELHEHFVDDPKLDDRSFLEKLEEQIEEVTPGATKLMAEMIWVLMLFPTNFRHETKLRKIRTIWEWTGESLPDSPQLQAPLENGIGSPGPGFINHQPDELGYLIVLTGDFKRMPPERQRALVEDPWTFVSWLYSYEDQGERQLRQILPHLLYPESFEGIASLNQKRKILEAFDRPEAQERESPEKLDQALLELRQELHEEFPDRDYLDFYRPPLIERWQLEEAPEIELAEEVLERAREAFLGVMDDFTSFQDPGESFLHQERGYKDVLRERFLDLTEKLPDPDDVTEEQAAEVVDAVLSLLTRKLEPYDHSQNLINWRYTSFLRELEPGEPVLFTRALVDLLDRDIPSPARVHRFNDDVRPILENHDVTGYAVSRSLPTLFLWLDEPDHEIYVRTDLFNSMAERLTGTRLFQNKRMDMGEYQRARAFARALRENLEAWGWKPKDMIDVQSFLWQAWSALKEEEKKAEKEVEEGRVRERDSEGYATEARESLDLQEIMDALEEDGFHFPPELVANYILALQTKRFAILTGISGTGKTKLAIKVAQFFASEDAPREGDAAPADRIRVIAVRPDWTDPRGLVGYHNPITERYVVTDFLRLLLSASEEEARAKTEDRPARPFFVVLDEMNLARVEHYFSDFLSSLESGQQLSLHHGAVAGDAQEGGSVPARVRVPRNVFFTGTVNVDETTHMFSPKVLDRAFTLELNEVDLDGWALGETDGPGSDDRLHLPRLEARLRWGGPPGAEDWREFGGLLDGRLRETVTALNRALAPWGYHFGYRVAGEIARFVLLAHRQGATSEGALWAVLDLALLEKVLPKFNGTEQELEPPLHTVHFVARHGRAPAAEETVRDLQEEPGEESSPEEAEMRLPRCARKVERMLTRLRQRGFAAFIE